MAWHHMLFYYSEEQLKNYSLEPLFLQQHLDALTLGLNSIVVLSKIFISKSLISCQIVCKSHILRPTSFNAKVGRWPHIPCYFQIE